MARKPATSPQSEAENLLDEIGFDAGDDTGDEDEALDNQDLTDPGDDEDDGSDTSDEGDENDEEDAGDEAGSDEDDDESDELAKAANRGNQREQEQKPPKQQRGDTPPAFNPFDPRAKVQTDKAGNIYLNGKKIANTGREARMYMGFRGVVLKEQQAAQKMAVHVNNIAQASREIMGRYEELSKQKTALDTIGASPAEQQQMINLFAAYKKNPIDGIKLMLTQAAMAGHDLKSITGGNGGIDVKALMDEMSGRMTELLKPVLSQTSATERQNEIRAQAKGFFDRNPLAANVAKALGGSHELGKVLNEAMRRKPELSMDEHFKNLHYALLTQGVRIPSATDPVMDQRDPQARQKRRRLDRNFRNSVKRPNSGLESVDDIAASVLRDARSLPTSRGT
jgi:hypothetical protein